MSFEQAVTDLMLSHRRLEQAVTQVLAERGANEGRVSHDAWDELVAAEYQVRMVRGSIAARASAVLNGGSGKEEES